MKMFKFCIGKHGGFRSTVWKVWTNKKDVYLQSRMMGSEVKISVHALGQVQFSRTDTWVKSTGAKNQDRHLYRWIIPQLVNDAPIRVLQIIFPESELQQVGNPRKISQIRWITPPQRECVKIIACYISKSHGNILKTRIFPSEHFETLQLDKDRYFVLLVRDEPIKKEIKKIILDNKKINVSYV